MPSRHPGAHRGVTMQVSIIVARARNGVIGREGALPWRLPADLRHFRETTMGKPVIMGRRTWESIGRPLPGRRNIVVTRQSNYHAVGAEIASSWDAALALAGDAPEVMVIGGAALYREALPIAHRIYLTDVQASVEGDTRFPDLDAREWREVERRAVPPDDRNAWACAFVVLERTGPDGRIRT